MWGKCEKKKIDPKRFLFELLRNIGGFLKFLFRKNSNPT